MNQHKIAIKYGIILGIIIVLYHIIFYYLNKKFITASSFIYTIYAIQLLFMIIAGIQERTRRGGLLNFKESLIAVFITFIVGSLFYYLMYYLIPYFDPEMIDLYKESTRENIEWAYSDGKGLIEKDKYKLMIEKWETDDFSVTIGKTIQGFIFNCIPAFFLSLLTAIMVKR